jgi:glutamate decarboxylase
VPAYTLPKNLTDLAVIRVVIKEGFSRELANLFLDDLKTAFFLRPDFGGL